VVERSTSPREALRQLEHNAPTRETAIVRLIPPGVERAYSGRQGSPLRRRICSGIYGSALRSAASTPAISRRLRPPEPQVDRECCFSLMISEPVLESSVS